MITIITPFKRVENLPFLIKALQGKCNWIVLQADDEPVIEFPKWVTVHRLSITGDTFVSNRLINAFINDHLKKETEMQYMILCDDDSVEEGFFDKIPDEDVVCVSMKRGDAPVNHVIWEDFTKEQGKWETNVDILEAKPENMKLACVAGEQLIVKGKILRNFRYGLSNVGDGQMVLKIASEFPITYVPDAYVLFNYFEDGRYKSFRRKPLALFIGDYYCAGNPAMGISEWEGNIASSLDATGLADVACFHFDKYYYHTGQRGDSAVVQWIDENRPDFIVLIIYKHFGQDPAVMVETTAKVIQMLGVPIITIWGDLEAEQQRQIAKTVEPYCVKMSGTASSKAVEMMGEKYQYMHVPKDPRIFNNPNKERDIDVVFSGSYGLGRSERAEVLQYLIDNGVNLVVGGSEGRDHFSTEEYADRYKRAKIAISFSRAHGMDVVNARPFEAMLCGALLLNQDSREIEKLYDLEVDYFQWLDKEHLLQLINYLLQNPQKIKEVATNGHKKTEELYSAQTFWQTVLSYLK